MYHTITFGSNFIMNFYMMNTLCTQQISYHLQLIGFSIFFLLIKGTCRIALCHSEKSYLNFQSHGLCPIRHGVSTTVLSALTWDPSQWPFALSVRSFTFFRWEGWSWGGSRDCAQIAWHLPYGWETPKKISATRIPEGCVINSLLQMGSLTFKWGGRIHIWRRVYHIIV